MTFQTPTTSVMQGLLLPLLASKSRCEGTGGQNKRCVHSKAGSWRVRADSLDYMRRQEMTDRGWHRLSCLDRVPVSTEKKLAEDGSSDVLFSEFQSSLFNPNADSNISYSNLLNSTNHET